MTELDQDIDLDQVKTLCAEQTHQGFINLIIKIKQQQLRIISFPGQSREYSLANTIRP